MTTTVAELFTLMSPYIRACVAFNYTPRDGIGAAEAAVTAAMEPLKAALDALVEERDRLRFDLDGVNAMREVAASQPPAGQQDRGEEPIYAKCYVCGKPMDGKSEDDCHCFHRRELVATASEATAAQQEPLSILATFVHEIWMGAYPWSVASGKARIALERAGLLRLEDVVALSSAAPANGGGAG